jgi:excisionase family DNA binding protein
MPEPDLLDFIWCCDLAAGLPGLSVDRLADFVGALEALKLHAFTLAARNSGSGQAPVPDASEPLTVDEVARRIGMSTQWIYREARAGRLPFMRRIGRRFVGDPVGLERWLTRRPCR